MINICLKCRNTIWSSKCIQCGFNNASSTEGDEEFAERLQREDNEEYERMKRRREAADRAYAELLNKYNEIDEKLINTENLEESKRQLFDDETLSAEIIDYIFRWGIDSKYTPPIMFYSYDVRNLLIAEEVLEKRLNEYENVRLSNFYTENMNIKNEKEIRIDNLPEDSQKVHDPVLEPKASEIYPLKDNNAAILYKNYGSGFCGSYGIYQLFCYNILESFISIQNIQSPYYHYFLAYLYNKIDEEKKLLREKIKTHLFSALNTIHIFF